MLDQANRIQQRALFVVIMQVQRTLLEQTLLLLRYLLVELLQGRGLLGLVHVLIRLAEENLLCLNKVCLRSAYFLFVKFFKFTHVH